MKKIIWLSFLGMAVSILLLHEFNQRMAHSGLFPDAKLPGSVIIAGTPSKYQKNNHVSRKVNVNNGYYTIDYTFKDHQSITRNWKVRMPESLTDQHVLRMGVPKEMLEAYYPTDEVLAQRKKWLKDGMFINENNTLRADHSKIATYYKGYTKPIADYAMKVLGPSASKEETVEFLLRFCQDIPYGLPPSYYRGKYTGQIFSPAQSLVNLYADCDSKAVLFASVYSHLRKDRMLFVHTPGHLSLAIEGVPKPYQSGFVYKNRKYVYAEPVGPGRLKFGHESMTTSQIERVDEAFIGTSYPSSQYQLLSKVNTTAGKPAYVSGGKQVTIYLNSPNYGRVTVFIDGKKEGEIGSYYKSAPDCAAKGTVTFTRKEGTYHFKATGAKGVQWEGDLTVGNADCMLIQIGD